MNKPNQINWNNNSKVPAYKGIQSTSQQRFQEIILFAYPLYVFENVALSNKQEQLELFYNLKKEHPVAIERSNQGGWQSFWNMHGNPMMNSLVFLIESACKEVFGVSCKIEDAWVNISGKNHFNAIHNHGGGPAGPFPKHISGVYYYKVPNNDSPLIFHQPSDFNNVQRHVPHEDQLIIFDPCLYHSVHPNNTDQDRISIAFNAETYL